MSKNVIITGVTGQDGSYLADLYVMRNYNVYGLTTSSNPKFTGNIEHLEGKIKLLTSNYTIESLVGIFEEVKPDLVLNMAAQPLVQMSWSLISETLAATAVIPSNILEAIVKVDPKIKFFQASSSEIYGDSNGKVFTEDSPLAPRNPYGCAKAYAYNMVKAFRSEMGIFATNGVLFNHESSRRKDIFLSKKIIKNVIAIYKGESSVLELGNLFVERDWGHAKDYMSAVVALMDMEDSGDYLICSGKSKRVIDMANFVLGYFNLDPEDYIKVREEFIRKNEPVSCKGSPKKIERDTGWIATTTFEEMLVEMIECELKNE
ncbi:GDP-mannose 4,6-dehydratase [Halobacteriovorax sp. RT-1-4]|uniref:GDP-mannose 4,6-dehydratase n=1 Tax=unclassified Halobacteriovorax TaxID=2639665 RepID=UPI00399B80C2